MKKTVMTLALAAFIAAGIQGISFAQTANQPHKFHPQMQAQKEALRQKLNLTEQQQAKAKAMRELSRDKIKPIFEEMKIERAKMQELRKNNASQEEIQKQRQKMQELKAKIREIHKQNLQDFEQILTPDQKTQFEQIKKEKKEKFQQKFKEKNGKHGPNNNFRKFNQQPE